MFLGNLLLKVLSMCKEEVRTEVQQWVSTAMRKTGGSVIGLGLHFRPPGKHLIGSSLIHQHNTEMHQQCSKSLDRKTHNGTPVIDWLLQGSLSMHSFLPCALRYLYACKHFSINCWTYITCSWNKWWVTQNLCTVLLHLQTCKEIFLWWSVLFKQKWKTLSFK